MTANTTYYTYAQTPAGQIMLLGDGTIVHALYWTAYQHIPSPQPNWVEDASRFKTVLSQLNEYFNNKRQNFDFPMLAHGTPFQKRVWQELSTIKFGEIRTYQQIATAIGLPRAVRAVGAAIGRNPLCIVVPCHRVIASSGKLTGFAGGLASKRTLLEHENALSE